MSTRIYFYSGTGNSLWTARKLAGELGDATIHPIPNTDTAPHDTPSDAAGLVFPVHIWGVPRRVLAFLDLLARDTSTYYFAVAVNAGQVAATLLQLQKTMKRKGLILSAGYDLVMPSNYIPWGGPGSESACRKRFDAAAEKIGRIAGDISWKISVPLEKGPLWQNVFFSAIYRMSFSRVSGFDREFHADAACNGCGVCERVCPAGNIGLRDGRPEWNHRCEQCLACIQWCPQKAIQYGKKTHLYPRYHHPEVTLNDMIACAPQKKTADDA